MKMIPTLLTLCAAYKIGHGDQPQSREAKLLCQLAI
jgi:hypothetical protein